MAQIIPPITSLPIDSGAAPSVEDIQDRLPSICVDYLSHNWTEEDVWVSWRNMTRHKHEIANGVRLENASWRTWNKQRNKLRTISPETLNWLKDSDVTWLYGPLHTANVEPVRPLKVSSAQDRLGIDGSSGKPGILKHRTLTELLSIPPNASSTMEAAEAQDEAHANASVAAADRPILTHAKSDTHLSRSNSMPVRRRPGRSPSVTAAKRADAARASEESSPEGHAPSNKRHISFNTFVEQYIALEEPLIRRPSHDSDSDDVLEIRPSRSHRSNSSNSANSQNSTIIAKIPPGVLKTTGPYLNNPNLPKLIYMPPEEYRSPVAETPPVVASPSFKPAIIHAGAKTWNADNEAYKNQANFDYFGGPDLTGGPSNPTDSYFGQAPAVQTPPQQPKWRQQSTDSNVTSSSSSSSSLNGLIGQQPQRGILKVRPANPNPSSPEPVSPPVIFNYNPSVATGIGGMFGGYEGAAQAGISIGSPVKDREARGRSTSRGNGSSQYDRSVSRTSVTSSTSSHSSVSRSPAEAPTIKAVRPQQPPLDKVREGATWEPEAGSEQMEVDDQSPDRSMTPTPHSSPQIALRQLKNTSPSSLPHASARSPSAGGNSELPNNVLSNATPAVAGAASMGNHDSVTSSPALTPQDDDDGSTLIGRATNIANTAKDLLGALWYGAQDDSGRPRSGSNPRR